MHLDDTKRKCTLSLESGHSTEGSPDLTLGGAPSRPGWGHGPGTSPSAGGLLAASRQKRGGGGERECLLL